MSTTRDKHALLFIAPPHGGSSDKTQISGILALDVWPIANQSDPWRGTHQGLPFHTPIAALPSCRTSVPVSRGHCIMVS